MLCGDLNGNKTQERGDICKHIANSLCFTAETKPNIVKQLYANKNYLKKKKKILLIVQKFIFYRFLCLVTIQ